MRKAQRLTGFMSRAEVFLEPTYHGFHGFLLCHSQVRRLEQGLAGGVL